MVQSLLCHGPERVFFFFFFFFFFFLANLLVRRPPDLPDLLRRHCIHRICVDATEHRLCICLSKADYFRRGSTFITIRFCIACNFFLYYFTFNNLLRAICPCVEGLPKSLLLLFSWKKSAITITQNFGDAQPLSANFYVCACACICEFFETCLETCQIESYHWGQS